MTAATTADTRFDAATLLGGCRYSWCLASSGCIDTDGHPKDIVIHQGRSTETYGLAIIPMQFDHLDGTPYSGPRIQFNGCPYGRIIAELTLDRARDAAATLARFAAGEVPVGSTARFVDDPTVGGTGGPSITVTRDPDETWCYSSSSRPWTFTSVRIVVDNPNEEGDERTFEFDGPKAAAMAREIIAITREMTA